MPALYKNGKLDLDKLDLDKLDYDKLDLDKLDLDKLDLDKLDLDKLDYTYCLLFTYISLYKLNLQRCSKDVNFHSLLVTQVNIRCT